MTKAPAAPGQPSHGLLEPIWHGIQPELPFLIPLVIAIAVLTMPLPGRGPGSRRRDPWRKFKFGARRTVMERAGHRCEAAAFMFFGRCSNKAEEADHIYPWSKGGGTVVANGQALCKGHNRRKSNVTPPWWYVLLLERRRRTYVPEGLSERVSGALSHSDRALHSASVRRRQR